MAEQGCESLLIIFTKNAVQGQVKTRLAADVGAEKAFTIFLNLLNNTRKVAALIEVDKAVFYADQVGKADLWEGPRFRKFLQKGADIGQRMRNALAEGFRQGYRKVCLIGSDIYGINQFILEQSFQKLDQTDLVLGPANDGGYYLIGAKRDHPEIYEEVPWSSAETLNVTLSKALSEGLTYSLLPTLIDIDRKEDLDQAGWFGSDVGN